MVDFRDPKFTKAESGSKVRKWIGIAVAALVAVLLLSWLLGWFADEAQELEVANPAVVEQPATSPATTAPVTTEPAATTEAPEAVE